MTVAEKLWNFDSVEKFRFFHQKTGIFSKKKWFPIFVVCQQLSTAQADQKKSGYTFLTAYPNKRQKLETCCRVRIYLT